MPMPASPSSAACPTISAACEAPRRNEKLVAAMSSVKAVMAACPSLLYLLYYTRLDVSWASRARLSTVRAEYGILSNALGTKSMERDSRKLIRKLEQDGWV